MATHSSILAWKIPWAEESDSPLPDCTVCSAVSILHPYTNSFQSGFNVALLNKNWASLVAQVVKNLPAMKETQFQSLGSGRSPGGRNGNPLQYSCLKNPMDRGAW